MDLTGKTIILYDGVCELCNRLVRCLLRFDRRDRFRYAPLQSDFARQVLAKHGINAADLSSVSVIARYGRSDERAYTKSDAIIYSPRELGGLWNVGRLGRLLPRPLRNGLYDLIARSRYRIFGRHDTCPLPLPEHRSKFIEL